MASDPGLLVEAEGHVHRFRPSDVVMVGRDTRASVPLSDASISRTHVRLILTSHVWVLEDLASTNGTYIGGRRVHRQKLNGPVEVSLGAPSSGVLLRIEPLTTSTSGQRRGASASSAVGTAVKLILLATSVAALGLGMFVLDWITVKYTDTSDGFAIWDGVSPDLDTESITLIAGAVSGIAGLLGIRHAISPTFAASLLILAGVVIAAWTLKILVTDLDDVSWIPPGFEELDADATFALGGFVTLGGAGLLVVTGILFLLDRRSPRGS